MIEILNYKPNEKGARIGFVSVKIVPWSLEIRDITVFKKGNSRWVSFPSREYESNGEKKYFPYIQFSDKSMLDKFNIAVLNALDKYVKENVPKEMPQQQDFGFQTGQGNHDQQNDNVPF